MPEVLVDTDLFVDHLRVGAELPRDATLAYSTVTRAELFAGRSVDEQLVRLLLSAFEELPVDRAVAEQAGRLRRELPIRTPDALIAATALVHDLGLATRNRRDFARVPKLRLR